MMQDKYVVEIPEKMAKRLLEIQEKRIIEGKSYKKDFAALVIECVEKFLLHCEHAHLFKLGMKFFIDELCKSKN